MQKLFDFLMDFWIDFGVIFYVFWDEKSRGFFDRFLDVLFLRLGNATPLQRDFDRGAYGPDAPQAAPLNKKRIPTPVSYFLKESASRTFRFELSVAS